MSRLGRLVVSMILIVLSIGADTAAAAPPSNDRQVGAIEVGPLPFTHSMDTSEARANGPRFCFAAASVFYSFTPDATGRVQVDLLGSEYDTTLGVYTRTNTGRVRSLACNDDRFGTSSGVRFRALAGVTYFFIVGQCCSDRGGGGGPLVFTVTEVSNAALDYAVEVSEGSADPATGIATLTGTVTCNERSIVFRESELRQLRQGIFIAREFFGIFVECVPGPPIEWSVEIETATGIAFGPGPASLRRGFEVATDGFKDLIETNVPDEPITLQ